ncbi:hypothetical protein R1flu_007721 [Riccia fluitans]|uniref:Uncharacterized protein n=1 Tax=Riccia fluitans TaxID=41844 RepID=A0ABD1YZN1_9MARC
MGPHGYTIAKAGLVGLVKSCAAELGPSNIRVNMISPGRVSSPMTAFALSALAERDSSSVTVEDIDNIVAKPSILPDRLLTDLDVANAALYLASDMEGYMNIRRHFGAQISKFFQRLVYATSQARYEEALGILEKDYPNCKEAVAYIKAIDPRKFSRYALVLPRYGRVTSNAVECMNAAFLKLREYAARRLLFEVWIYVMRSFYERRTTAEGSIDLLTEYAKGRLSEFEREYGSQAIPPVTKQDLVIHITCRAPEAAVRRGRARTVRIPNGGGSSRRHREYMYPMQDEARLISSQGPLTVISDQAAGPSTQDGRGKSQRRRVIAESELEGPSSSQRVIDPDASTPIQRSKTCEDLTNRLVEAGGTIAGLAAELKQKDCEVAALKERLQGSEQKLQREEARNAWLNEFTGTLTSELQTLRTEGTKAKLTGKVPDRDWLHEAKQRWRAHPTPENLFRLTEALEEHEDQILVREKMFLKHAKYLTVTVGDEEAPPDILKAAVVLCRRNDVLYTSAERQEQLDRPFTSFPGWNCAVSSEGATYFRDPVQLRRSRLILPFLFDCLDRYITMFEGEMPLEHRKEMLSVFFKEVDTKFPDSVLDAEDRYPGPYDLRAELKHLLSFYLRREIADREEIADYMQQVGSHFMRRTWAPECWNSRVIERNLAVVHGIPFHDLG